jgi:DNA-binding LacI/PurR family transcriptional regulator
MTVKSDPGLNSSLPVRMVLRMASPTLRSLARKLGFSIATISAALNGTGRVSAATARRIKQGAKAAGYKVNPLASAVMSEFRRSSGGRFRGAIAVVDIAEPFRPDHAVHYHRDLIKGVVARAEELGFATENFVMGHAGLTLQRLDGIIRARNIRGIVLLPSWNDPDISKLDWSQLAGIYTDYIIERPALHTVYPDHYHGMILLLQRLWQRGYRRPGLFVMRHSDERLQYRWEAGFLAFAANAPMKIRELPRLKTLELCEAEFRAWFRSEKPDVVIAHQTEAIAWMRAEGAVIPGRHGFVCLNVQRQTVPCAALDLQPQVIGSLALEQLVAQLHRREFGIPRLASSTTVPPRWMEGPTVRRRQSPRVSP